MTRLGTCVLFGTASFPIHSLLSPCHSLTLSSHLTGLGSGQKVQKFPMLLSLRGASNPKLRWQDGCSEFTNEIRTLGYDKFAKWRDVINDRKVTGIRNNYQKGFLISGVHQEQQNHCWNRVHTIEVPWIQVYIIVFIIIQEISFLCASISCFFNENLFQDYWILHLLNYRMLRHIDFTEQNESKHDVALVINGKKIYASKQVCFFLLRKCTFFKEANVGITTNANDS